VTHDDLVKSARRWLLKPWRNADNLGHAGCSVVLTECTTATPETPDVIGWAWSGSILIECKTSRADFAADARKPFRQFPDMGMGEQRYYMASSGLLSIEDLPPMWGLIEAQDDGSTRVLRASERFAADTRNEVGMLLSLIRRLRVEPGRHVTIRAYTVDCADEPRATATIDSEGPEGVGETAASEDAAIRARKGTT
jgi:hypothetical protein